MENGKHLRDDSNINKDPNKPKRPLSAFLIFMEDFRKEYKEIYPDSKGIKAVGKAGGNKWKKMSEEARAPYNKKASERKAEYEKSIGMYNKRTGSVKETRQPKTKQRAVSRNNEPERFHVDLHAESDENESDDD